MQMHYILFCCGNRCQVSEKETEMKELKEQLNELVGILRHSEGRRKEMEKYIKQREQAFAAALATPPPSPVSFYLWKIFTFFQTYAPTYVT